MLRNLAILVGAGAFALGLSACGSGPPRTCDPSGTELHIAVPEASSHEFDTKCLAAPADQAFTIRFDNNDTSYHGNHNITISDGDDLFVGDVAPHGSSITYEVGPMPVGTYSFRCDHHPFMNGTFLVG